MTEPAVAIEPGERAGVERSASGTPISAGRPVVRHRADAIRVSWLAAFGVLGGWDIAVLGMLHRGSCHCRLRGPEQTPVGVGPRRACAPVSPCSHSSWPGGALTLFRGSRSAAILDHLESVARLSDESVDAGRPRDSFCSSGLPRAWRKFRRRSVSAVAPALDRVRSDGRDRAGRQGRGMGRSRDTIERIRGRLSR